MTATEKEAGRAFHDGQYRAAASLYRDALRSAPQGPPRALLHLGLARSLALLLDEEADAALSLAQREISRHFGAKHAHLASLLDARARFCLGWGRTSEAVSPAEEAHALRVEALGPEHPDTADSLVTLAEIHYLHQRDDFAKSFYEEALRVHEILFGPKSAPALDVLNRLGFWFVSRDPQTAATYFRQVHENPGGVLHPQHPVLCSARWNLALLLQSLGQESEALHLLSLAYEGFSVALGLSHPKTYGALRDLAESLSAQGRDGDARAFLADALRELSPQLEADHPWRLSLVEALSQRAPQAPHWMEGLGRRYAALSGHEARFSPQGAKPRCVARCEGRVTGFSFTPGGASLAVTTPEQVAVYQARDLALVYRVESRHVYDAHPGPGGDLLCRDGDGAINLWHTGGAFHSRLEGVFPGAFARLPNGASCLVSLQGSLHLYDLGTRDLVRTLGKLPEGELLPLALSQFGDLVAAASFHSPSVHIFSVETGGVQRVIECPQGVRWLSFAPDGSLFVALSDEVLWWQPKTFAPGGGFRVRSLHKGPLRRLAVSPDGAWIATASAEPGIGLFLRENGAAFGLLEGHAAPCEQLAFHPDGTALVSLDDAGQLRWWAPREAAAPLWLPPDEGAPGLAFFPEGDQALVAGPDGGLRVWESQGAACARLSLSAEGAVSALALSPRGETALLLDSRGLLLADLREEDAARVSLPKAFGVPVAVAFSLDASSFWAASETGAVAHWRISPEGVLRLASQHARTARPVWLGVSPDGSWLYSLHQDGSFSWGESDGGHGLARLSLAPAERASLSKSGRLFASAQGNTARLYRVSSEPGRAPTLSEIGLVECPAPVGALCFAPDDGALVVGSGGGLRFVQPVGGALIEAQAVHTRPVVGLAFSPDGRTLLSCDTRGALACFSVSAKRLRRW